MNFIRPKLDASDLFSTHHDDSGWSDCSCDHGVYCGYYGEYGDCLSHTVSMLWGDWNVCCNKRKLFDWCREGLK